jgi:oxygen-independent coproporphyrinogen-3 oxidase
LLSNKAGLYVHYPYCEKKCGFCDFYSEPLKEQNNYFSYIIKEMELYERLQKLPVSFDTLYIGGGTPSLLKVTDFEVFLEYLEKRGHLKNIKEITLEANPESVEFDKLSQLKKLGVNRISLGVQSLDEKILKKLGRVASFSKTIESILMVKDLFTNYSLDLIYGIKEQDLCQELFSFATFAPPHLSAYMLSLEASVPFYKVKDRFLEKEDLVADYYESIREFMQLSSYNHYEVSSFALKGKESLHNTHYWMGDEFLGLGAGASGYLNRSRTKNAVLKDYIKLLEEQKLPIIESENLYGADFFMEDILLKLRLNKPFCINHHLIKLDKETQTCITNYFKGLEKEEYLMYNDSSKTIIPHFRSWLFLNYIIKGFYNILLEKGLYGQEYAY